MRGRGNRNAQYIPLLYHFYWDTCKESWLNIFKSFDLDFTCIDLLHLFGSWSKSTLFQKKKNHNNRIRNTKYIACIENWFFCNVIKEFIAILLLDKWINKLNWCPPPERALHYGHIWVETGVLQIKYFSLIVSPTHPGDIITWLINICCAYVN